MLSLDVWEDVMVSVRLSVPPPDPGLASLPR